MSEELAAVMVDVSYALHGKALPRDHRLALAAALERLVPWLSDPAQAGLHRVNTVAGTGAMALLSQRARLALRVRRERLAELAPLAGAWLEVGGHTLRLGDAPLVRELLPYGTLYAHLVASSGDDELTFLAAVEHELDSLGVACRPICGRRQTFDLDGATLTGFSLMLDCLTSAGSLRVLESGLGHHRRLGCGIFVPHKSAAALRA
jgi:CRISPR-associated protein Cas6